MSVEHTDQAKDQHQEVVVGPDNQVPDGTICPDCFQPRPSHYFYSKKWKRTTSICRNCIRKRGQWAPPRRA